MEAWKHGDVGARSNFSSIAVFDPLFSRGWKDPNIPRYMWWNKTGVFRRIAQAIHHHDGYEYMGLNKKG